MNIYDKAHELAAQIKESDEFKTYSAIKKELFEDETAKGMIRDYKKLQFEAQTAFMTGKEPEADLMEKIQKMGEVLQFNPKITEFFSAEYKMQTMAADLYKIIGDACDMASGLFEE